MHPAFQSHFVTPDTHQPLSFHGTCEMKPLAGSSGARWCDGELVTTTKEHRFAVVDTVPIFVTKGITWPDGCVEQHGITPEWIASKYYGLTWLLDKLPKVRRDFCHKMATSNELILEVACGPDGGNMPYVLMENPDAKILANELGYNVLKIWRAHQKQYGVGPNLSFACFDARHAPLESDCVDIISSFGGFTEIGTLDVALKEAHRVLKPGGRMYICEWWYTHESVSQLPADIQKKLNLPQPELGKSLEEAGFTVVRLKESEKRAMRPDAGGRPKLAHEHGVTLETVTLFVEAVKRI